MHCYEISYQGTFRGYAYGDNERQAIDKYCTRAKTMPYGFTARIVIVH